jgi:signal peptidase II
MILASGAIGNLIDRIRFQYVVDFIYIRLINFPIFNFADICVSVSAVLLVVFFIFIYKDDKNFPIFSSKKSNDE